MEKRIIGVNSNCYHGYSIERAIEGIAKAGFTGIELTCTRGWTEHVLPSDSFEWLHEVKNLLKMNNLKVIGFSGHSNLVDSSRLEDFRKNIQLASFFGSPYIVSSVGEAHIEDKVEVTDDIAIRNIKSLLPLLEELDMDLVLETHGEHGSASRIRPIVDAVASPRVRICYDTANAIFYGNVQKTEDAEANTSLIDYVHIKDKAGERTEWNFPALGKGYVDFPALLEVLDHQSLSIEIEFTEKGAKDAEEIDQAVLDSAVYLKSLGYSL